MAIGTVKWFNATKGYGFIQPDDGSKDVFLHISDVQRSGLQDIREGDKLQYDVQQGQQGKTSACNLKMACPSSGRSRPTGRLRPSTPI
jgi:CspA family cold shock protein